MEFSFDWQMSLTVGGIALGVYIVGLLGAGLVRAIVTPKRNHNEEEK